MCLENASTILGFLFDVCCMLQTHRKGAVLRWNLMGFENALIIFDFMLKWVMFVILC